MRQKRTRLAAPGQLKKRNESIKSREIFGKKSTIIIHFGVTPYSDENLGNVTHHDSLGLDHHLNAMNEGLWMTF